MGSLLPRLPVIGSLLALGFVSMRDVKSYFTEIFSFYLKIKIVHVWQSVGLCARRCPGRPEAFIGFPGIGIRSGCDMGAEN